MTKYLGVADLQRMISELSAERMLAEMAQFIREDFLRWESYQKSARTANHSPDGVIELMPISDAQFFAFKYVNGHPKNPLRQLPTVMAFGVLADVATGYPLLLSELTIATALRTAATSALAASLFARADSRSMALIGNGAQSEFQAIAFMDQLGIREIRAYDIDREATDKLMLNLAPYIGAGRLRVVAVESVRDAVAGADIITTLTADKSNATILSADMIQPGVHINAVGGDCPGKTELDARILEMGAVAVEFEPQTRIEGELQQMPADFPVRELWKVLQGVQSGRTSDSEITIFDSVGFALEDLSALRYLHAQANALDMGQHIEIVPRVHDPKDLYGYAMHKSPAMLISI
ncbi:ornithine cyclodeaminase [Acidovorax sp. Be4]|uniref:Ornithine cyclodeaminase n=1 Tax=Acidovorax bellezanensis TaxID=2976702 RepID=A0ABT2PN31_9BURK|nr:ornithine cyclodeaminase [Acidovorax sp. Be4]MCT9811885.1 ornithine cyclodeaminase [Acidovorax sp. Be4]